MSKLSIKILGTLIVVIFITCLAIVIITNKNYLSTNSVISNNNSNIISLTMEDNKLKIIFDNKVSEYCIKTTKTKPSINNICFKKVNNNTVYTSIYKYKKYYIWTMDNNGNISDYVSYDGNK